ncbi:unnamed protein product [Cylindrotheca closterium]|uniref:Uncharacterized protein n=1 Tax=Cylindrotheca closterium TaxID=2856 RepID=A0AAD2JJI3_9STRA|nr:unnamed protein product [Cylindrotheca closterium]
MDRFLRSHLMQIIYRSASLPTSPLGFKMCACVKMHNMHVSDSFPEALGITSPAECQAFVNYLFPYEDEERSWDGHPEGYVAQRLPLPSTTPVVPPVDNDMAEFIQAAKHHKPSSRQATVCAPIPAPGDLLVLTEDGHFEDGHGTNFEPPEDHATTQLPAVTPSPLQTRHMNVNHPDSNWFQDATGGNPFAGGMNRTNIPLQSPAQGMPPNGIHNST